jgi:hypothetical protein
MRQPATLFCLLFASVSLASAARAAPANEVYLGDVASPRAALHGKTFRLKPGQRLRFTNLQKHDPQRPQVLYFYEFKATPRGALYHGAMVLGTPRWAGQMDHYRQETFTVLKKARPGTLIKIQTRCPFSADWTLSFQIQVVP